MLVLTHKLAEKLYIGPDICITIVRVEGSQVRIGIEAPREVPVVRAELLARDGNSPARPEGPATNTEPRRYIPPPAHAGIRTPATATHGIGIRRRGPSR
jgi:carbon storage regulator